MLELLLAAALAISTPAPEAAPEAAPAPPGAAHVEAITLAQQTIARLRPPLHDIELRSRAVLATGKIPAGFMPFLHDYAVLRDRLDTAVSNGDPTGAVAQARQDLAALRALARKAQLTAFDPELARCQAALAP